jgi:hypothetical protein
MIAVTVFPSALRKNHVLKLLIIPHGSKTHLLAIANHAMQQKSGPAGSEAGR